MLGTARSDRDGGMRTFSNVRFCLVLALASLGCHIQALALGVDGGVLSFVVTWQAQDMDAPGYPLRNWRIQFPDLCSYNSSDLPVGKPSFIPTQLIFQAMDSEMLAALHASSASDVITAMQSLSVNIDNVLFGYTGKYVTASSFYKLGDDWQFDYIAPQSQTVDGMNVYVYNDARKVESCSICVKNKNVPYDIWTKYNITADNCPISGGGSGGGTGGSGTVTVTAGQGQSITDSVELNIDRQNGTSVTTDGSDGWETDIGTPLYVGTRGQIIKSVTGKDVEPFYQISYDAPQLTGSYPWRDLTGGSTVTQNNTVTATENIGNELYYGISNNGEISLDKSMPDLQGGKIEFIKPIDGVYILSGMDGITSGLQGLYNNSSVVLKNENYIGVVAVSWENVEGGSKNVRTFFIKHEAGNNVLIDGMDVQFEVKWWGPYEASYIKRGEVGGYFRERVVQEDKPENTSQENTVEQKETNEQLRAINDKLEDKTSEDITSEATQETANNTEDISDKAGILSSQVGLSNQMAENESEKQDNRTDAIIGAINNSQTPETDLSGVESRLDQINDKLGTVSIPGDPNVNTVSDVVGRITPTQNQIMGSFTSTGLGEANQRIFDAEPDPNACFSLYLPWPAKLGQPSIFGASYDGNFMVFNFCPMKSPFFMGIAWFVHTVISFLVGVWGFRTVVNITWNPSK